VAGERVLVVDDYDDNREAYAEYLRFVGYEVSTAADGDAALRCALQGTIDVIVLDVALPKLDGLAVLNVLRSNSMTRNVPVIILSASVSGQVRDDSLAAGANLFLAKPCLPEDLESAIRKLLSGQS
jgi:two-component system, cell cycle response regulator DivK